MLSKLNRQTETAQMCTKRTLHARFANIVEKLSSCSFSISTLYRDFVHHMVRFVCHAARDTTGAQTHAFKCSSGWSRDTLLVCDVSLMWDAKVLISLLKVVVIIGFCHTSHNRNLQELTSPLHWIHEDAGPRHTTNHLRESSAFVFIKRMPKCQSSIAGFVFLGPCFIVFKL